jgi:hypothetical protein
LFLAHLYAQIHPGFPSSVLFPYNYKGSSVRTSPSITLMPSVSNEPFSCRRYHAAKCTAAATAAVAAASSSGKGSAPSGSLCAGQPPPVQLPWLLTANTRLEALFDADIGE